MLDWFQCFSSACESAGDFVSELKYLCSQAIHWMRGTLFWQRARKTEHARARASFDKTPFAQTDWARLGFTRSKYLLGTEQHTHAAMGQLDSRLRGANGAHVPCAMLIHTQKHPNGTARGAPSKYIYQNRPGEQKKNVSFFALFSNWNGSVFSAANARGMECVLAHACALTVGRKGWRVVWQVARLGRARGRVVQLQNVADVESRGPAGNQLSRRVQQSTATRKINFRH